MAEDTNLPIQPQSNYLVKAGGLIKVTNKLLSESDFEFYGDFKGNIVWKIDAQIPNPGIMKIFVPQHDEYFLTYGLGYFYFWSKETGALLKETYLGDMSNICLIEDEESIQIFYSSHQKIAMNTGRISLYFDGFSSAFYADENDESIQFIWPSFDKDKILSYNSNNQVRIWDTKSLTQIQSFEWENFKDLKGKGLLAPDEIAYCPIPYYNNKHLIILTKNGFLQRWNIENGKKNTQISIKKGFDSVRQLALNMISGDFAIWEFKTNKIDFWNIEKETNIQGIEDVGLVWNIEFSLDGNYLFVLTAFDGLKIYETKTYNLVVNHDFDIGYSQKDPDCPINMGIDNSRKEIYVRTNKGVLYKIN